MSKTKLSSQLLQEFRELAARWGKIAAERASSAVGPDQMDFQDMEQLAAVFAAGLTQGTLTTLLAQLSQTLPKDQACPECGHLCVVEFKDRDLTLESGQRLPLHEPVCHCPHCRRDFFPPAKFPTTGQPQLQSHGVEDDR